MAAPISAGKQHISAPLAEGLLVARPMADRLFFLNSTARFIWERVVEGVEESDIPPLIAAEYGIDLLQARLDFSHTLRRWRNDGLIRPGGEQIHCEVAGIAFDVRSDAAVAGTITSLLSHLATSSPGQSELEIDLEDRDGTIVMRANGTETGRADDTDMLIAKLLSDLYRYVGEKSDWTISLHAAVVAMADGCVLLPGASGAGKSSLAAALMSLDEMQFIGDDLALLAGPKLEVIPVPLPVVLKSGSWDLLHPMLPELAGWTVRRRGASECRYWAPPRERIRREPTSVRAIVFPRYVHTAETALTRVSPMEAFARMISAPSTVRPPIARADLEVLARFLHTVPTFTLTYGNLAAARSTIRDLLRCCVEEQRLQERL